MNMSMESVEKATQNLMQACEEINGMARAFGEATMQSATAMTKGWEEISRSANGILQESMARTMTASKSMMGMRDMRQVMQMQQDMMKDCMDCWMAGTGKMTEISARVSKEVVEPVAQQVSGSLTKIMSKVKAAA